MQTAADHGFTAIADVDIMDSEGQMSIPVANGKHLTEDIVGVILQIMILSWFFPTLRDIRWAASAAVPTIL